MGESARLEVVELACMNGNCYNFFLDGAGSPFSDDWVPLY